MHEYSLACEIFEKVMETAHQNKAAVVNSITLQIGRLTHINPDQLLFSFNAVAQDSIAASARVKVEFVEPFMECPCGFSGPAGSAAMADPGTGPYLHEYFTGLSCPVCGETVKLTGGRELLIQAIEIEE